jgi:sigma-E factor negative regulatory protein RseC
MVGGSVSMSQNAIVIKIIKDGVAEVSLLRQTDCKNCDNCGVCSQKPGSELLALASNEVGAKAGDIVEVDSTAGNSIGIAVIVYVVPCVCLLLGYFLGQALGLSELACVGVGALGVLVGFLPALVLNRVITKRKQPEFVIRAKLF